MCLLARRVTGVPGPSGIIVHSDSLFVKEKGGDIKRLIRLPGHVSEENYTNIWLFAELQDTEDVHTIIRDKSRWVCGGKFGVADTDFQGPADLDDASLPTSFEIS